MAAVVRDLTCVEIDLISNDAGLPAGLQEFGEGGFARLIAAQRANEGFSVRSTLESQETRSFAGRFSFEPQRADQPIVIAGTKKQKKEIDGGIRHTSARILGRRLFAVRRTQEFEGISVRIYLRLNRLS